MNKLVAVAAFDEELVKGVEVTYSPNGINKFRCTIRQGGAANNEYAAALEEEFRPYRQSGIEPNDIAVAEQRAIIARCLAKHIIIGWNEADFEAPYSVGLCTDTLIKVPGWATFIANQSGKENLFRKKSISDASGN